MKTSTLSRFILLCCLCITMSMARAQYVAISDPNFVRWINTTIESTCMIGNQLDTNCAQSNPIIISTNYYDFTNDKPTLDLSGQNISDMHGMGFLRFSA